MHRQTSTFLKSPVLTALLCIRYYNAYINTLYGFYNILYEVLLVLITLSINPNLTLAYRVLGFVGRSQQIVSVGFKIAFYFC